MNGAGHGWRQVGFEYRNDNNISILGCEVANSQTVLAAPASSNAWMPQLLPAIYNRTPDLDTPEHDDPGGLAGSLALLIALAAYSTEPANMIAGIGHSFQVPVWRPHNWRHGRTADRGMVVSIYLDSLEGTNHVKNFEQGLYGPIFR
ncbi:MAG: hypothetical protein FRX48_02828 [Lasallia pustulata]|uniref:Uncharacterized protein n=1 Tax=Lasallia pustulata TaxID=136370 RepID=A0A5M8PVN2_9LECA|nr:MAG: hypothetical protein FRX48_02828 [Lasallia pustulata]